MSAKDVLNLTSSSISMSEFSDEDDKKFKINPNPLPSPPSRRPCLTAVVVEDEKVEVQGGSTTSTPSSSSSPVKRPKVKLTSSKKEKDMMEEDAKIDKACLSRLGIDIDDEELKDMEEEEERVPVDSVIHDLLNLGRFTEEDRAVEKLKDHYKSLSKRVPLEITGEGRCAQLKADVERLEKMKEGIDALIEVLEATRDKVVNDKEHKLVYTEPPMRTKKKA